MTAERLHLLLTLALAITGAVILVAALIAFSLPLLGEPLLTTWQVHFEAVSIPERLSINVQISENLMLTQGVLSLETLAIGFGISRGITILIIGGICFAILYYLRQITGDLKTARPFNEEGSKSLKKAGYLLIALPIVLFLEVYIRFYSFIPEATKYSDFWFTHIRLFTETNNEVLIVPDFNVALLFAGFFVVVLAKAFEIGVDLQTDKDEII